MIVKDDYSRFTKLYFLRTKDEAERFFARYIAEISPRKVEVVRSDDGGEFTEGEFGELCDREKIKQENTTADSPEFNGVVERALGITETAGLAARIQASELYPNDSVPSGGYLWAEQANWACHALNRTATSSNPKSSLHMRCFTEHHRKVISSRF